MKAVLAVISFLVLSLSTVAQARDCQFEFDIDQAKVMATGYKFTEKVGVQGRFTGVKLNKTEKAASSEMLLKDLAVTVDLMTLDSGNALRDRNLRETLFSGILGDSVAVVSVKKINPKTLETELKINEKTQTIMFDYEFKDGMVVAKGTFDALAFALGDQLAALKKRCGSLHTGSDGQSVTWSEFALEVQAPLKRKCESSQPAKNK